MLRRCIVEIYVSSKAIAVKHIDESRQGAFLPSFHLNVDLWTAKSSHLKYIGVRIFFVDQHFNFATYLLAVRAYQPSTALADMVNRSSDILLLWVRGVLQEYNLREKDLASSTTDAGSDIKRLCDVLLPCPWDWCMSHLLNVALVEAFGTSLHPDESGNPQVRALISRVKRVIEHVNKSEPTKMQLNELQLEYLGSSLTLLTDVPQRWKSTINCLKRVLELFDILRCTYSQMGLRFDLDEGNVHTALIELYSLMEPVANLITDAQASSPAAPVVMSALCYIAAVLDPSLPLSIIDPAKRFLDPKSFQPEPRAAHQLLSITIFTRKLLLDALRSRFYSPYALDEPTERSLVMDMAVFFYPPGRSLRYVDALVKAGDSPSKTPAQIKKQASYIREQVQDEICLKAIKVRELQVLRLQHSAPANPVSAVVPLPLPSLAFGSSMRQVFDFSPAGPAISDAPVLESPGDLARAEMRRYLDLKLTEGENSMLEDPRHVLSFWRRRAGEFPLLSIVARSVLGKPVSAAAIERDFGEGSACVTPRRNRLDRGCVEMSLFIRQNQDCIPPLDKIPSMTASEAVTAFPKRFCGEDFMRNEHVLFPAPDQEAEDDEDGEAIEF